MKDASGCDGSSRSCMLSGLAHVGTHWVSEDNSCRNPLGSTAKGVGFGASCGCNRTVSASPSCSVHLSRADLVLARQGTLCDLRNRELYTHVPLTDVLSLGRRRVDTAKLDHHKL